MILNVKMSLHPLSISTVLLEVWGLFVHDKVNFVHNLFHHISYSCRQEVFQCKQNTSLCKSCTESIS